MPKQDTEDLEEAASESSFTWSSVYTAEEHPSLQWQPSETHITIKDAIKDTRRHFHFPWSWLILENYFTEGGPGCFVFLFFFFP